MSMYVSYLGVGGAWGVTVEVAGVPTQFAPIESYSHSAITIRNGCITAIDFSGLGGGGTSDHAALTHLDWASSGHTGAAWNFAGWDGTGAAGIFSFGAGFVIGSLTGGAWPVDILHGAIAGLAWVGGGHTGPAGCIPFFDGTTAAAVDGGFYYTSSTLAVGYISTSKLVTNGTGVNLPSLTASTVPYLDASKYLVSSSVTPTELGYLSGATSNLQSQINGLIAGLSWKVSVRCATTTNGTLTTAFANGQTVDGVVLATGDRILLKNQTTGADNGIYTVNASGAPTRATDMDTSAEALQATVFVRQGTTNADTQWTCTNDSVTLGTTALTWAQVSGSGTYSAGSGLTLTGNVFSIASGAITNTMLADATLQAFANYNMNGLICQTAADTWAQRTITGPAAGITVSNGDGVSGNPTLALANDLSALEGLGSTGIAARTATDTWAQRTITGTANKIDVTNGDGVSGNPTLTISATYAGQSSIVTLGTVTTGTWSATAIAETKGGTNQTTYTLGDTLYASAANTLSKLAGQTTTFRKFLRQTGTGAASAAPAWDFVKNSDICGPLRVSGRLTLTSGDPFPTGSQTAKTTIYWTPYIGNTIPIYDSTPADFINRSSAEVSVAVPSTLFRLADVFAYWTGSAVALETLDWNQTTATINAFNTGTQTFTTSAAHGLSVGDIVGIASITGTIGTDATYGVNGRVWTVATVPSSTTFTLDSTNLGSLAYTSGGTVYRIPNTRATSLTLTNGIYTKTGDNTRTFVGTVMTTGTSGQTEMSLSSSECKLLLWNAYNRLPTFANSYEGSSHSYTTGAWRYWNLKPANRIQLVNGLATALDANLGADGWGGNGYNAYAINGVSGMTPTIRNANASLISGGSSKKIMLSPGCNLLSSVEYGAMGWNSAISDLYATVDM